MSLIRQIWLLMFTALALAVGGAVAVNLTSARETLQAQVNLKNADNAQALALALSQLRGDRTSMELLVSAQADTGHYQRIRFVPADGSPVFERGLAAPSGSAPLWFRVLLPIDSQAGVAQVSDGWRELGRVEVVSHVEFAHAALWSGGWRALLWMALVGATAAAVAGRGVRRLQAPIAATVEQATSLSQGRFVLVDEPAVPELQRMAAAMNGMVKRLREVFEVQAAETEHWRQLAHCDAVTGLPHRRHFFDRLSALRQREDGPPSGSLVLLRLADLDAMNRLHGRPAADAALRALAAWLNATTEQVADSLAGRLNGADFALFLPGAGPSEAAGEALAEHLRATLAPLGADWQAHLGAVELLPDTALPAALAQADMALARAELGSTFTLAWPTVDAPARGEQGWREQMLSALGNAQSALAEFPVLDGSGVLSHLECPLRLPLEPGGALLPAAHWLPMAVRCRLTPQIDLQAVRLALAAIARDGRPRGVNVAPASLADQDLIVQMRGQLLAQPEAARQLWVEVAEQAAIDRFGQVQELARQLRPFGVRVGLEHAGPQLREIARLYELGLDFVKLDASVCAGVAASASVQAFVRGTVRLLLPLGVQVLAEGVSDSDDAQALWACGVTAVTGPWASAHRA